MVGGFFCFNPRSKTCTYTRLTSNHRVFKPFVYYLWLNASIVHNFHHSGRLGAGFFIPRVSPTCNLFEVVLSQLAIVDHRSSVYSTLLAFAIVCKFFCIEYNSVKLSHPTCLQEWHKFCVVCFGMPTNQAPRTP